MPKEMLINVSAGEECRIAVVDNGKLEELYMERASAVSHVGNVYKGKVTNVEASIQAAFIDFGIGRNGFLHVSDLMPTYWGGNKGDGVKESVGRKLARRDRPPIQHCLRRGDEIVVQVIKEGLGTKGPTLSSYLSIPGRILVMMPGVGKSGVSKKIEDEDERRRLRKILDGLNPPKDAGFIIRTAGVGRAEADIERDFNYLTRLWENIQDADTKKAPLELYAEGDLVMRTVRDVYTSDIERIVTDDAETARRIKDFFRLLMPKTKNRVDLYEGPVPLFHEYGIERDIENMHSRVVPLKSGGSLVIDQTEAVTAIDVNSGKSRQSGDAETTAFKTDLEAADEIPRQLKLRDLGGIVICDFIDLRFERHRRELEERLAENLKRDRAKTRFLAMSEFGIIEMTRQRMRPSLKKSVFHDCPHCAGHGLVKTAESMGLDVIRRIAIAADNDRVRRVELALHPDVAVHVLNTKRVALAKLEEETGKVIRIKTDADLPLDQMHFDLYDDRDGAVWLDVLGMEPPQGHQGGSRREEGRGGRRGRGRDREEQRRQPVELHHDDFDDEDETAPPPRGELPPPPNPAQIKGPRVLEPAPVDQEADYDDEEEDSIDEDVTLVAARSDSRDDDAVGQVDDDEDEEDDRADSRDEEPTPAIASLSASVDDSIDEEPESDSVDEDADEADEEGDDLVAARGGRDARDDRVARDERVAVAPASDAGYDDDEDEEDEEDEEEPAMRDDEEPPARAAHAEGMGDAPGYSVAGDRDAEQGGGGRRRRRRRRGRRGRGGQRDEQDNAPRDGAGQPARPSDDYADDDAEGRTPADDADEGYSLDSRSRPRGGDRGRDDSRRDEPRRDEPRRDEPRRDEPRRDEDDGYTIDPRSRPRNDDRNRAPTQPRPDDGYTIDPRSRARNDDRSRGGDRQRNDDRPRGDDRSRGDNRPRNDDRPRQDNGGRNDDRNRNGGNQGGGNQPRRDDRNRGPNNGGRGGFDRNRPRGNEPGRPGIYTNDPGVEEFADEEAIESTSDVRRDDRGGDRGGRRDDRGRDDRNRGGGQQQPRRDDRQRQGGGHQQQGNRPRGDDRGNRNDERGNRGDDRGNRGDNRGNQFRGGGQPNRGPQQPNRRDDRQPIPANLAPRGNRDDDETFDEDDSGPGNSIHGPETHLRSSIETRGDRGGRRGRGRGRGRGPSPQEQTAARLPEVTSDSLVARFLEEPVDIGDADEDETELLGNRARPIDAPIRDNAGGPPFAGGQPQGGEMGEGGGRRRRRRRRGRRGRGGQRDEQGNLVEPAIGSHDVGPDGDDGYQVEGEDAAFKGEVEPMGRDEPVEIPETEKTVAVIDEPIVEVPEPAVEAEAEEAAPAPKKGGRKVAKKVAAKAEPKAAKAEAKAEKAEKAEPKAAKKTAKKAEPKAEAKAPAAKGARKKTSKKSAAPVLPGVERTGTSDKHAIDAELPDLSSFLTTPTSPADLEPEYEDDDE